MSIPFKKDSKTKSCTCIHCEAKQREENGNKTWSRLQGRSMFLYSSGETRTPNKNREGASRNMSSFPSANGTSGRGFGKLLLSLLLPLPLEELPSALLGQTRRFQSLREMRPHPLHLLLLPLDRRGSEELERAGVSTFACRARQRRRGERQAFP